MITIFDIFQFAAMFVGGVAGYRLGSVIAGNVGVGVGVIVGVVVGWAVGRAPWFLVSRSFHKSLKQMSSSNLRSRLVNEYYISHLIIAELVSRGESVESFRQIVTMQLNSESLDVQRFGQANAQAWFPELLGGRLQANKELDQM